MAPNQGLSHTYLSPKEESELGSFLKQKAEKRAELKAVEKKDNRGGTKWKNTQPSAETSAGTSAETSAIATAKASAEPSAEASAEVRPKKRKVNDKQTAESIDTNVCCMCFGRYEDDVFADTGSTDWLSCACGRWLHEDCVEDIETDSDGKDRMCPYCLDGLAT